MIGLVGLRAILDPVPSSADGAVMRDVSEVVRPSSSTCSKEDSGLPDELSSLPLSVGRYVIRGSDDMLEEAYLGS
jgi:hypothetical protein